MNCSSFATFEYVLDPDQSFSVTAQKESGAYSPWVNMTNTALFLLRNEKVDEVREYNKDIDLILQHNDPGLLHYEHNSQRSNRKPDSIFMTASTACALHGVNKNAEWTDAEWIEFAKQYATLRPKGSKLNWGDAFSSVEYKRDFAQAVSLMYAKMPDANSFMTVLKSEHILGPGKRKISESANKTEDENTVSAYVYVDCLLEC